MQQLPTSEEIVKENMMVFPLQVLQCVTSDNPLTQVFLAASLLAGVHFEFMEISIVAIGKAHTMMALFTGFSGMHVLLQRGATCELCHRFVNCYLLVKVVQVCEV